MNKSMTPAQTIKKSLVSSIEAKQRFLNSNEQITFFENAVSALVQSYKKGGRLYVGGNGGSAADAQHLVAEFVSKLNHDRDPLPAEALTVDTSILTAIGNDYGYDQIFSRQIRGKLRENDVFLGITTSGNSINILKALEICKEMGILTIVFTGKNGGKVKAIADHCIVVPAEETATIQEVHIVLAHALCECVEAGLGM